MTCIILVRHGQTEWNRIERFWHLRQDTCAINVLEAEQEDFVLVSLNDTCHLRQVSQQN